MRYCDLLSVQTPISRFSFVERGRPGVLNIDSN